MRLRLGFAPERTFRVAVLALLEVEDETMRKITWTLPDCGRGYGGLLSTKQLRRIFGTSDLVVAGLELHEPERSRYLALREAFREGISLEEHKRHMRQSRTTAQPVPRGRN